MLYSNLAAAQAHANEMCAFTHSLWTVYEVEDGTGKNGFRTVNGIAQGPWEGYTLVSRHKNGKTQ